MAIRGHPLEGLVKLMPEQRFWRGKTVLVTGFEGFLGTHLCRRLIAAGAKLIGLDIRTGRKQTIFTPQEYRRIKIYTGSINDAKLLRRILKNHPVQIVFHLAAESIVGRSEQEPLKAFRTNIAGTWELLEALRHKPGIAAVVVASSDKAYGCHKKLPYREDSGLFADHPYDVSKSCTDQLALTYARTYGLPAGVIRSANIYGPGDFNFSRLIPDALRCLAQDKTLLVRSDGKFVRDYLYVDDAVQGYLLLARALAKNNFCGEAFNLSSFCPVTVAGLLLRLKRFAGGRRLRYKILNRAKNEIRKQYLSAQKARRCLGFKPEDDLDSGLRRTAQWYFEYFRK